MWRTFQGFECNGSDVRMVCLKSINCLVHLPIFVSEIRFTAKDNRLLNPLTKWTRILFSSAFEYLSQISGGLKYDATCHFNSIGRRVALIFGAILFWCHCWQVSNYLNNIKRIAKYLKAFTNSIPLNCNIAIDLQKWTDWFPRLAIWTVLCSSVSILSLLLRVFIYHLNQFKIGLIWLGWRSEDHWFRNVSVYMGEIDDDVWRRFSAGSYSTLTLINYCHSLPAYKPGKYEL